MAGGAGVLVLEEYEQAKQRGATILAEVTGYGMSSDGGDMVFPSAEGCARAITMAVKQAAASGVTQIDYVNAHATGTPMGDISELNALRQVFGNGAVPPVSSTKGLSGHGIGAAGAFEAVFALQMLQDQFIAGCGTTTELDAQCAGIDVVLQSRPAQLQHILSNSFGFGGTNAALVFSQVQ
jgi:3-oxoacyl-[acyl-carrier-protein] synthase-1